MFNRDFVAQFPEELFLNGDELSVNAVHFENQILLQIRFNGEMDTTYEVSQKGLRSANFGAPLAGQGELSFPEEEDGDNFDFTKDNLSDYEVVTKLGNSNDMKLPVICTQISELFQRVILPSINQSTEGKSYLITTSSKIWRDSNNESNTKDFNKLVFVLKCVKNMYQ